MSTENKPARNHINEETWELRQLDKWELREKFDSQSRSLPFKSAGRITRSASLMNAKRREGGRKQDRMGQTHSQCQITISMSNSGCLCTSIHCGNVDRRSCLLALPLQSSNESEQKAIESIRLSSVSLDDGAKVFQRARESGLGPRAARLIRARLGP